MSTPDQPDTPPLTRKQLREIRNTGSTPIVTPAEDEPETAPAAPAPTPLPRAAEPAAVAPAPVEHVDLGVSPLTRRQARQQERIRTASVPIIAPDLASGHTSPEVPAPVAAPVITSVPDARPADAEAAKESAPPADDAIATDDTAATGDTAAAHDDDAHDAATVDHAPDPVDELVASAAVDDDEDAAPLQVDPDLGSGLLAGEAPAASLPASFDQLIARNASTGSISAPNALILSQTPAGAPLVGPVTATGEVLITGTFELPDGLGSVGHAPGVADGKDLDVALIDGELPAASSPTPIAASAAISTVRNSGEEIIRPPAPEKGSRLMLALVITAGVLALALAGVLILAITTGRI